MGLGAAALTGHKRQQQPNNLVEFAQLSLHIRHGKVLDTAGKQNTMSEQRIISVGRVGFDHSLLQRLDELRQATLPHLGRSTGDRTRHGHSPAPTACGRRGRCSHERCARPHNNQPKRSTLQLMDNTEPLMDNTEVVRLGSDTSTL